MRSWTRLLTLTLQFGIGRSIDLSQFARSPIYGFIAVVIRLRLPNGKIYKQVGHLDYVSPTIDPNTDTITLRGVIPNPVLIAAKPGQPTLRELTDQEFVTVLLEGVQPVEVLAIPRTAVLSDQQGDYVYVVDAQNRVQMRRIHLGQSTPQTAVVTSGLKEGELVISEGVQRARPGKDRLALRFEEFKKSA
jgi:membrane fusion protein, multidrug efflux system